MGRMPSAPQSVNCHQGRPLSAMCLCPTPRCWHAQPWKPGQKQKVRWNQKPKMHFHLIPVLTSFLPPPPPNYRNAGTSIHQVTYKFAQECVCLGDVPKPKKHAGKVEQKFYLSYKLVSRLGSTTVTAQRVFTISLFFWAWSHAPFFFLLPFFSFWDVPLMEFMYLVFINTTGADYCRQMVVRHLSSTNLPPVCTLKIDKSFSLYFKMHGVCYFS